MSRAAFAILICIALSGCVSFEHMSKEARIEEAAWQSIHLMDVLQTREIARDPCYIEDNPVTREIIGRRPSEEAVIVWGIGLSYLHAAGTTFIAEKTRNPWPMRIWQAVSIGVSYDSVSNNHEIGIRIGGGNKYRKVNPCFRE